MSAEKNFEIDDEELHDAVGGKEIRSVEGPWLLGRKTRRAGGQRATGLRREEDELHES